MQGFCRHHACLWHICHIPHTVEPGFRTILTIPKIWQGNVLPLTGPDAARLCCRSQAAGSGPREARKRPPVSSRGAVAAAAWSAATASPSSSCPPPGAACPGAAATGESSQSVAEMVVSVRLVKFVQTQQRVNRTGCQACPDFVHLCEKRQGKCYAAWPAPDCCHSTEAQAAFALRCSSHSGGSWPGLVLPW